MPSYKCSIVLLSITASNAFHLPIRSRVAVSWRTTPFKMAETELSEVDKLRAAAAKAREEYERLSKVC